ncbi:MAG TPA: hypothetical protein VM617_08800 [Thermoanaerobaculia bacterium]|nr:hypothetical protein [Thermoanaerobaculia bacterium]
MDDRELRESLRHLPEARAGADFTESVLARVTASERRRETAATSVARWRPALLAAGLLILVALALGRSDRPTGGTSTDRGPQLVATPSVLPSAASDPVGAPVDPERSAARTGAPVPVPAAAGSSSFASPPAAVAEPAVVAAGTAEDFFAPPPAGTADAEAGDRFAAAADRLARLRAERAGLEARLAAFRRELPPAEPPVVVLGADDGLELVFDLAEWSPGERSPGLRPAVYLPSTPFPSEPPRRF